MAASGGPTPSRRSAAEVFWAFLRLGLTSFGGPIAHLGYFRDDLVVRRRWLEEAEYAELVGLCQLLPGPASSQVGFAIGLTRAGPLGGLAAWAGFTLPSAMLMFGCAVAADRLRGPTVGLIVHGLKLAAVAIVAQALVGMARTLTPDVRRLAIAAVVAGAMLLAAQPWMQVMLIASGAVAGILLCRDGRVPSAAVHGWLPSRSTGLLMLATLAVMMVSLPLWPSAGPLGALAAIFLRAGALVFGGGHVVLPLLQTGLVPNWINNDEFLAGYGAAQAVPGPLFTLAAFLGATAAPKAALLGSAVCTIAIFTPGLMLAAGVLPFRSAIGRSRRAGAAIAGINASVVGILAAAFCTPVWSSAVRSPPDVVLVAIAFVALVRGCPPLIIVVGLVGTSVLIG